MKEYFPADYAKVQKYVAAGRGFRRDRSMEEKRREFALRRVDYPAGALRQAVFPREFGKTSAEYMLPDCFGFPASLPSILAHAGIQASRRRNWRGIFGPGRRPQFARADALGTPFNVGIWEGPMARA